MYSHFPLSLKALACVILRLWPVAHRSSSRIPHPCQKSWEMRPCRSTLITAVNSPMLSIACSRTKRYGRNYARRAIREQNSSPGPDRQARCSPSTGDSTKELQISLTRSIVYENWHQYPFLQISSERQRSISLSPFRRIGRRRPAEPVRFAGTRTYRAQQRCALQISLPGGTYTLPSKTQFEHRKAGVGTIHVSRSRAQSRL